MPGFKPMSAAVDDPERLEYERACIQDAKIDADAFDYLYDYYYERVFRFFYNRLQNRDDAEALTSDVFFLALDRIWQFRWQSKPFHAWLYRIAINRLNRHFKVAKRQQYWFTPLNVLGEDVFADSEGNPALKLERAQLRVRLDRYLGELTAEERNWLALRYHEDLPVKEIAAIYGVSEGTMKARLFRTREKLRRAMTDGHERDRDGYDGHD
ncbi:sigma-70 family RNA polymerase sigma factor [bacterium]|nr:sigma-70 family RNA polymerase sigma factor [bacterium]